ncbi:MAG: hypothetical protein WDO12_05810 [Pseudomonadota bacterium]
MLAFLRTAVRKDDEAIATQHARLGHPGLLVGDDSLARLVGL